MNNPTSIRRIRWTQTATGRWYGFTSPIMTEKCTNLASISDPVSKSGNWCKLTDTGRHIINKIINMQGVSHISANSFGMIVQIEPVYQWADYHENIVELLNNKLFGGQADVGRQGVRQTDEGLILWSGTRKSAVRWYGTSKALQLDDKNKYSAVISGPVDKKNWCGLTPAARELVNTIYAIKGVYTIWVSAFDMSIEIAPVFSWTDYHDTIVKLLKEKIFDNKASVEQKQG